MTKISVETLTATTSGARPLLSIRDMERGLRAMGLSVRQAKKLLAKGYKSYSAIETDSDAALLDDFEALVEKIRKG